MTDAPVTAPIIEFVSPIMGFGEQTAFHLVPLDDEGTLWSLRDASGSGLRLVVVAPTRFFPGYAPEIDDETVAALDLRDATEAAVLNVVTVGDDPASSTVNLWRPSSSTTARCGRRSRCSWAPTSPCGLPSCVPENTCAT